MITNKFSDFYINSLHELLCCGISHTHPIVLCVLTPQQSTSCKLFI